MLFCFSPFSGAAGINSQEQEIFNSLKYAGGQGRSFAVLDPVLCQVARHKAADMANRDYYSHTDPDGHGPNWLVRQTGYSLPDYYDQSAAGNNVESVNAGRASAGDAWSSWMDSSGHRTHLLGENSFYAQQTSVGVGFVDVPGSEWRYYWVVITAPPAGPSISIKSPKAGQEINATTINVSGFTSGKPAASRIEVRLENSTGPGEWHNASGADTWNIALEGVQPGSNTIRARSIGSSGEVLDETNRNFRYVVVSPLSVQIAGEGSVSKGFEGITAREVGQVYRIAAKPAPGWLFAGWTGSLTGSAASAEFTMSEGFNLTATFIANPFIEKNGTYTGFAASSTGSPSLLSLKVSRSGRFSGKLRLMDLALPLRGRFDASGRTQFFTSSDGITISFDLAFTVVDGGTAISGTVAGDGWSLPIEINAAGKSHNPSVFGRYTVVLSAGDDAPPSTPQGDGFATVRVNHLGATVLAGVLADGTPFSATGFLNRRGELPIFLALCRGSGAFAGNLTFQPSSDIAGHFQWIRPALSSAKTYAEGFTLPIDAVGGKYVTPKRGEPVVRVNTTANNTELEIGAGGFIAPVVQPATLAPDNSVTVSAPALSQLSVTIKPATGLFRGHFVHPETGEQTTFRGAVVQTRNAGFGFFIADGSSGYATIAPSGTGQMPAP
ncbi:MAG TPA: CAP domain-containing protein [Chthoniobacteraceae bacterium]|nr:CAP domain-containing protein [Chthoniobacteraceae bacterium]